MTAPHEVQGARREERVQGRRPRRDRRARPLSRDKRWRVDQAHRAAAGGLRQESSHDPDDHHPRRRRQLRRQEADVHQGARRLAAQYASLGDVIVVSVKEAIPSAKVKKGEVAKAVIVRTTQGGLARRRQLHPVRRQLRGADQQGERADRHPHLRAGRSRAARQEVHEDHLARAGGAVMARAHEGDTWSSSPARRRASAARSCACSPRRTAWSIERVNDGQAPHQADPEATRRAASSRRRARVELSNVALWCEQVRAPRRARRRDDQEGEQEAPRLRRSAAPCSRPA